ncbi:MAG: hypothetical protein KDC45_10350 [Bacteroidetes bacterium]|nr:hypothetical protein [Bacteroidota bacterium]
MKRWLGEWLTIFVSIMAAFSLDRCNEQRINRNQERLYIESMAKDLQKDSLQLETNVLECNDQLSAFRRTFVLMSSDRPSMDSILIYSLNALANVSQFIPQTTTYESVKGTGGLSLVSDFSLRNGIVEVYHFYEQVRLVDKVQLDLLQTQVLPWLNHDFDLSVPKPLSPTFMKEPYFRNLILLARSGVMEQEKIYEQALKKCSDLKQRLESSLD